MAVQYFNQTPASTQKNSLIRLKEKVLVLLFCLIIRIKSLEWSHIESRVPSLKVPAPTVIDSVLNPSYCPENPNNKLVLCRERNGWCPYSERVWLALEVKNIDYDTVLIDNMGCNRPDWYSGQTPQVKFVGGERFKGESIKLVEQIDREYPDSSISLYPNDREREVKHTISSFKNIFPRYTRPSSRAAFLFRSTGDLLWRSDFEKSLKSVEKMLMENTERFGGPFMCGPEITAADCCWAPFLERWAAQLPMLYDGLHANDREVYPRLAAWYEAMDTLVPCYASRIKGDVTSWCKVLQQQGYGKSTTPIQSTRLVARARLHDNMCFVAHQYYARERPWVADTPHLEAVALILKNREHIVTDMLKHSDASFGSQVAEEALYHFANYLLESLEEKKRILSDGIGTTASLDQAAGEGADRDRAALTAATYLTRRVCVPRDMGSTTAKCIYDAKKKLEEGLASKME